jgi:precorrin-6A/cobalt-precorrin-6A reductase
VTVRVLVLGGTGEARRLAALLAADATVAVTYSLAGRVGQPLLPVGRSRIGGFGGPDGLTAWLRTERIDAVIDSTHPFAATITASAVTATARLGVPLVVLRRPGWQAAPGDVWHWVDTLPEAAAVLPTLGERALLTTGRQDIAAFTGVDRVWFLARSVEPPEPPLPANLQVVLDRGPFTLDGELALLREHRIDVVVTKDSGGPATSAKLTAAGHLGLPVLLVHRPPLPPGVPAVSTEAQAADWLASLRL